MSSDAFISISMDGTPNGTRIEFADGRAVRCQALAIEQRANNAPKVSLTLDSIGMRTTIHGPVFQMGHPESGAVVAVKRIEFADGTSWEAPPCSA